MDSTKRKKKKGRREMGRRRKQTGLDEIIVLRVKIATKFTALKSSNLKK